MDLKKILMFSGLALGVSGMTSYAQTLMPEHETQEQTLSVQMSTEDQNGQFSFNGQIEGIGDFSVSMDETGHVISYENLTEEQIAELETNGQLTLDDGKVIFTTSTPQPLTEEELKEMGFEVIEMNPEDIEILEVEDGLRVKVYQENGTEQGFITSTNDGELKMYQIVSESSIEK